MFRIVSVIAFLATFVGISFHYIVFRHRPGDTEQQSCVIGVLKKLVHLLTLLFLERRLSPLGILRKLVYLLALLCFLVLTINGFYPSVVLGERISGYYLMLQVTAGGIFAGCLAVLSLMWAHHHRFNKSDLRGLQHLVRRQADKELVPEKYEVGQKITFWLITFLALPVILSIALSMFPLFGTEEQQFLLNLHRYSALLLALVAIVHTYLIIRAQVEQ